MEDVDVDMNPSSPKPADPDSDWVRITSTDGFSYMVKRRVAKISGTLRNMLDTDSNYTEAITRTCPIAQRGIIVEKMVEYMLFKAHYDNVGPKEEVPVNEIMERLTPEIVLELLLAADYQEL